MAAFPEMLERDRKRSGFTVGQVAWRLGVSPREYREIEPQAIEICQLLGPAQL